MTMEKSIAVWGTDKEAVQIYYKLEQDGQKVERFFDNRIEEDDWFLDKPLSKPTSKNIKSYFIYIGCKYHTYRIIADQLETYGLDEMRDFLWYDLYKKKIVVLHGNCHMSILRQYLMATKKFIEEGYSVYPNQLIHENKKGYINENVLQACNILIQQDIRGENEFGYKLSTDYLSSKLNREAKNIRIPNLYLIGYSFFPLQKWNVNNEPLRKINPIKDGIFPRIISVIDEMLAEGKTESKIIEGVMNPQLLSKDEILANFEKYISKIRTREEECDIKISDFILQNYQEQKIFYDVAHPTNYIIEEIWRQVCGLMGIKAELEYSINDNLGAYEDPVLPCVQNALGLRYNRDSIRTSDCAYRLLEYMNLEEYVKEYIWWRNKIIHGKQLKNNSKNIVL